MPFEYNAEVAIADVAIHAWDESLAGTFQAAAEATAQVMVEELDSIRPVEEVPIEVAAGALDMLLFELLQEMIFQKDAHRRLLRIDRIEIRRQDDGYRLRARARGEPIDPKRHQMGADVKAVTLHRLAVRPTDRGWDAEVVLDV